MSIRRRLKKQHPMMFMNGVKLAPGSLATQLPFGFFSAVRATDILPRRMLHRFENNWLDRFAAWFFEKRFPGRYDRIVAVESSKKQLTDLYVPAKSASQLELNNAKVEITNEGDTPLRIGVSQLDLEPDPIYQRVAKSETLSILKEFISA